MWLVIMFDLPVLTKLNRKYAARFRKDLLRNGFSMMQYSVYVRPCESKEYSDMYKRRVRGFLPPEGSVYMLNITDKQYADMEYFIERVENIKRGKPDQISLF